MAISLLPDSFVVRSVSRLRHRVSEIQESDRSSSGLRLPRLYKAGYLVRFCYPVRRSSGTQLKSAIRNGGFVDLSHSWKGQGLLPRHLIQLVLIKTNCIKGKCDDSIGIFGSFRGVRRGVQVNVDQHRRARRNDYLRHNWRNTINLNTDLTVGVFNRQKTCQVFFSFIYNLLFFRA